MAEEMHKDWLEQALDDPNLPKLYSSSVTINVNTSSVTLVFRRHDEQQVLIDLAHPVAKSMIEILGNLLAGFEQDTGHEILSSNELASRVLKSRGEGGANED